MYYIKVSYIRTGYLDWGADTTMFRSSNCVHVLRMEIWGKNQKQQNDKIHLRLILLGIYKFGTKEEKYRAKIIGVFNHAQFGVIRNAIKKGLLRPCL